ncbi:MAG: hypothetical protein R3F28_13645 [Candidatus Kapaibacterium sp.]
MRLPNDDRTTPEGSTCLWPWRKPQAALHPFGARRITNAFLPGIFIPGYVPLAPWGQVIACACQMMIELLPKGALVFGRGESRRLRSTEFIHYLMLPP